MLVVQQNYGKGYKCIISALEAILDLNALVVYIIKQFVEKRSISHSSFNFY